MNCSPYALNLDTLDGSLLVVPNDLGTRDANAQALGEASSLGSEIFGLSEQLRARAVDAANAAQTALQKALGFYPTFAPIQIQTPSFDSPSLINPSTPTAPNLDYNVNINTDIASFTPRNLEVEFTPDTAIPPDVSSINIQPHNWVPKHISAPVDPGNLGISIDSPPSVSITTQDLPNAPNFPTFELGSINEFTLQPIQTPEFVYIDSSELDRAVNAFRTAISQLQTTDIEKYEYVFYGLYSILQQHLSSRDVNRIGEVATKPFLIDKYFVTKTAYPSLANKLYKAVESANIVLLHRWLYEYLPTLYDICVRAHKTLFDIETTLYNLEFQQHLTIAEASIELLQSSVAVYNARVALYNAELIRYSTELSKYKAALEQYKQQAELEGIKVDINQTIVDAYATQEQVKQIRVRIYETELKQKAAELRAYEAKIKAMSVQLAQQEAEVQKYKASVLTWESDIESILANYKLYRTNLQALLATIKTEDVKASITQAENRTIAAQAQILAAQTSAKAAQIRSSLVQDSAQYELIELKNSVLDSKYNAAFAAYSAAIVNLTAKYKALEPKLEGQRLFMDSAKTYMQRAADYYSRAANLIQNTESRLAKIRADLAETVGKTGAAIEQGKLAGFRASISASADANISGAHGWGHTFDNNLSTSYSKGEHVNRSLSA